MENINKNNNVNVNEPAANEAQVENKKSMLGKVWDTTKKVLTSKYTLIGLGVAAAGGAGYYGYRWYKARKATQAPAEPADGFEEAK